MKENKYLLPHLITGLIKGSYNWSEKKREELYELCLPYFLKGFEVKNNATYEIWISAYNEIIKKRDIKLYKNLL